MERGGRGQRRCRPEAAGLNAERPARCLALERANPSAPSPKAQCAQGAPARQEGGYQPFFPFLQPPPQRPRGRSSVGGGAWQGLRQRVLCVGWGCRRGGLALPAPCRQGAAQAPSSVPPRPAGGDQGIQTYLLSGWDTEGTGQPRPPAPLPGGTRWVPLPLLSLGAEWGEEWERGWREEERRAGGGKRRGPVWGGDAASSGWETLKGDLEGSGGWEWKGGEPRR